MGTLASELRSLAGGLTSAPRVYVDANIPCGVVTAMRRELGWDVLFVLDDPALRRAPDRDHFVLALDLGRTLITLDHDFLDDRRFPPGCSPGLIVCSAPDERALMRMIRYADRAIFRASNALQPLRGQKRSLTLDVLAADATCPAPRHT